MKTVNELINFAARKSSDARSKIKDLSEQVCVHLLCIYYIKDSTNCLDHWTRELFTWLKKCNQLANNVKSRRGILDRFDVFSSLTLNCLSDVGELSDLIIYVNAKENVHIKPSNLRDDLDELTEIIKTSILDYVTHKNISDSYTEEFIDKFKKKFR